MQYTYTNYAYANIKNNTGVALKRVTLTHQYSDDQDEGMSWTNVAPGSATPAMRVNYNTGFMRTGQDYWWVQYTLPDDSVWISPGRVVETLGSSDQGRTKTFTITGSIFKGRSDSMQLHKDSLPNYNAWAAIVLRNDFPVELKAKLEHKYSDDVSYEHAWPALPPGSVTGGDQAFIVYFNTGFITTGSDHWTLTAQLDIPPYENSPEAAFKPFTNATSGKACMLESSDNGKTHEFAVNGKGMVLGILSGACSDQWKTWNGYNTFAFIEMRNDFATDISTVVLTHQYSGDAVWRQTRGLIRSGKVSQLMVAECNTGAFRTGLDYWNVYVYLENGEWYQNHKSDKECMLSEADAISPSTFAVSADTFTLGLRSGSCTDAMDKKGIFSPTAGRDVSKPYNENAFIGSHNAFANFASGFWYAQQSSSLATQLAQGATTLLLDIWHVDGDIYLKHADAGILQPFVANQKLSDALTIIRDYLTIQSRDPVTLIFEDRVEARYQDLIKKAFVDSKTWEMVFSPTAYGVNENGWPTLSDLFAMRKPLIVLTSNRNSPDFAYQWDCMSENVYGNDSLSSATWLDPRTESKELSQQALCALNHFPTWSLASANLVTWLGYARKDNDPKLLATMIDACFAKWGRYPNYINADFWEVPDGGLIEATVHMNEMLHKLTHPVIRFQHGRAIVEDIDQSRLLRGDWARAIHWIDQHFDEICPTPDIEKPGPIVHQLMDAVNLALVVSVIRDALPPGETVVRRWVQKTARELVRRLLDIESRAIEPLNAESPAAFDELSAVPYFLMERASDISFNITDITRHRIRGTVLSGDLDRLLLAGLAGHPDAAVRLADRLTATRAELANGGGTTSRTYDLTHEILYRRLLEPSADGGPDLSEHLADLLDGVMATNQDLGAELLACYWITGGSANESSRAAVERLKAHSEELPYECGVGDGRYQCQRFKEEVHNRLTMVLGLGVTLGMRGEVLDQSEGGD